MTLDAVKVSGADFDGILAEKTSGLTVENSSFTDNGFKTIDKSAPLLSSGVHSLVSQAFAISLFGVSHSTVKNNRVFDNGRGGIGVMDNGPNDPGAITQSPAAPLLGSTDDTITGNKAWKDYNGCGIVIAIQNFRGSLSHIVVTRNTITGAGTSTLGGPVRGGFVVAADLPDSTVSDVIVSGNTVRDSWEGGLIVNAEAPIFFDPKHTSYPQYCRK